MAGPTDQEATAVEKIAGFPHSSQEKGIYRASGGNAGKDQGGSGGRNNEGTLTRTFIVAYRKEQIR